MDRLNINEKYDINGFVNDFYNENSQLLQVRQLHEEYSDDTSM